MRRFLILFLGVFLWTGIGWAQENLFGNNYAVVVGINRYKHPQWSELPYPEKDAQGMYDFLKSQNFVIKRFYGTQAKRNAILGYLKNLALRLRSNDRFLFFFSGHGETLEVGTKDYGYIIPVDGTDDLSTWIAMDELELIAEQMNAARQQLFLFDSCFGGMFGIKSSMSSLRPDIPGYIEEVASRKTRQYITAGGKNEQVLADGPDGYSYFTGYLLKALGGEANTYPDSYITASELLAYLVPAAGNRRHTPSGGTFRGHEQGEFLFKTRSTKPVEAEQEKPTGTSLIKGSASIEPIIEPVEAEYVVRTKAVAREKPSILSRHIGSLKRGEKVWVAGRTKVKDKTWFLVDLPEGQQGFVYENSIKAAKTQTGSSLTLGSESELKRLEEEKKRVEVANLPPSPKVKEIDRDAYFMAYADGTVTDTKTGLMWAGKDNGRDLTWQEAKQYCENYRGGGYTDWRMPTADELATLYNKVNKSYQPKHWSYNVKLTKLIELTTALVWASETRGSRAPLFDFYDGLWHWALHSSLTGTRALPVRVGEGSKLE